MSKQAVSKKFNSKLKRMGSPEMNKAVGLGVAAHRKTAIIVGWKFIVTKLLVGAQTRPSKFIYELTLSPIVLNPECSCL